MSRTATIAVALGLGLLLPASARAAEIDPTWEGAGGLVLPLGDPTPVRIDYLKATFTAYPPPRRTLEDPRFAGQWEVSTRMDLTNGSDAPCTLTLGLPQVAADDPDAPPAISHVVISLDEKRMRVQRVDEPGPVVEGVPALEVHHRVSIDFEPGQSRRVDTLFRVRAAFEGGAIRFRFVLAGASRFAGGEVGEARLAWYFRERVRLVAEGGGKLSWIAAPPAGAKHWFFDDGRKSRLQIELPSFRPPSALELAVAAVGLGPEGGPPILGRTRLLEEMSALELRLARSNLLALHGRMFRDPELRRVYEDLPWSECSPAHRVAHGRPVEEATLADFLAAHPCRASCERDRKLPVDPYGSAWEEPLCWYAPLHNLTLTRVVDQEIDQQIKTLEKRLELVEPPEDATAQVDADEPGCLCRATGAGRRQPSRRGWLFELLAAALGFGR